MIAPGFIGTDTTNTLSEISRKKLVEKTVVGRLGTSTEIAAAVLYLV